MMGRCTQDGRETEAERLEARGPLASVRNSSAVTNSMQRIVTGNRQNFRDDYWKLV
jgi:hypothetical protein